MSTCVIIPFYRRNLSNDEQVSLRRLGSFVFDGEIRWVGPEGVDRPAGLWPVEVFDEQFFAGVSQYSSLLLKYEFYAKFCDFDWILICQLDALIVGQNLSDFLEGNFHYIGAPWFRSSACPGLGILGVGNGGLSLRNVDGMISVLTSGTVPSFVKALSPSRWMPDLARLAYPRRLSKALRVIREARRGVEWYTSHYTLNEDKFWSFRARLFDPTFRIAPVDKALEFSFECFPRYCYELNGRRLPFGCHAWAKHDRAFWEQFIDRDVAG